ncbi:hypothetical protein [Phocaeicola plebeius]|jgi:hypothetical protein|uniref:hypothetical protein n=1 Tax=Phocaeicola plebeius TaxID=310297 RepID=UPI003AF10B9B
MSKQVLDIQQMQHLEELGVDDSNASVYWHRILRLNTGKVVKDWFKSFNKSELCLDSMKVETVPTFTLDDIFDLIPSEIMKDETTSTLDILKHPQIYIVCFWSGEPLFRCDNSILIDAAYEMLCWCAENGYVDTKK